MLIGEWIKMSREELVAEVKGDKDAYSGVVDIVEEIAKICPNAEIDAQTTYKTLYKAMEDYARANKKGNCYYFVPSKAIGFIKEQLKIEETETVTQIEPIIPQAQKAKKRVNIEDFL